MKFGHEYAAHLREGGFPENWTSAAVKYRQLKKCIVKVTSELRDLGLDPATLSQLLSGTQAGHAHDRRGSGMPTFEYEFDGNQTVFHPKLTIFYESGLPVDASISPETRRHLQNLALRQQGQPLHRMQDTHQAHDDETEMSKNGSGIQEIEVPLTFDSQFFDTLHQDVSGLETLQSGEQSSLSNEIVSLSREIMDLSKPSKFSKTDMNRWRELFAIYLEANIFFSTRELDHGRRDSATAVKQLRWFQNEVVKRKLTHSFKLPASHNAFERFVHINTRLLMYIRFQEYNSRAVFKILKKFDKRTHLGAVKVVPKTMQPKSIMPETMAKAVCAQLSEGLLARIPQMDDYACPICFSINWRPVRMKCDHVLCISCAVTLQQKRTKYCPFCRGNVILEADASNIDPELESFLEKHFPKEVRAKRIEVETERGKEQFGPNYKHPSERHCLVM